jgi:outer membrane biosynthesis protein TonB
MLRGLPASIILHAAVIAAGAIVLPTMVRDIEPAFTSIPIEIVELSDETNIRARPEVDAPEPETEESPPIEDYLQELDTIPPEEPEPEPEPEPETAVAPPPPAPEPEPEPEPAPAEEEPEPEPESEPEPEPDRPVLAQTETDPLDDILGDASNLFDRTPRERTRANPAPPPQEVLEDEQPRASEARRGAGEQTGNTANVVALINNQMRICWDDVVDLPNPERLNVVVRVELNRDGSIKNGPDLVDPARPPIGDRSMGVAIERALRAVRKCAPYRLPEGALDYYDDWDEVTLNIGPAYRN